MKFDRYFGMVQLVTDSTISTVPHLKAMCTKSAEMPNLHETVKEFLGVLSENLSKSTRFRIFPNGVLTCCALNPDSDARAMLTKTDMESAKKYLMQFEKSSD